MRVNVFEEGSENVIWYKVLYDCYQKLALICTISLKERFLGDDEIIENLVVSIFLYNITQVLHK